MLLIILKSSACLAIFMLFYKLYLEKTSAHTLKRFYLIGVVTFSMVIPFITFTTYIEVEPINVISTTEVIENSSTVFTKTTQSKDYLPIILWSIYALGVILFSFRFFKNLYQLVQKTHHNPKYKNKNFIHVLITDLITPHTFFNYIFLNKTKFENNQIPKEVLLHEETHAIQKHSLDVLFIEILQIIFWFNPMIYFIKHSIKLNHEFLADQAVINHGVAPSTYQQILLAFSSPDSYRDASELQLTNAINYSSIKKRFTVMNTHTSKKAIWLRSLIILPLLAFLIYGFSEKVVIQKEVPIQTKTHINQNLSIKTNLYNYLLSKRLKAEKTLQLSNKKDSTELKLISERIELTLKDIGKDNESLEENNIKDISDQQKATPEQITEYKSLMKKYEKTSFLNNAEWRNMSIIYNGFMSSMQREENKMPPKIMKGDPEILKLKITREDVENNPEILNQIREYNSLAKKFNNNPEGIFKAKDIKRVIELYNLMSDEQKKGAEPFPKFTPPPAIPENASPEDIKTYNKRYGTYKELMKDLKK